MTAQKLQESTLELEASESISFVQLEALAQELEAEVASKEKFLAEQGANLQDAQAQLGRQAEVAGVAEANQEQLAASRAENELLLGRMEELQQRLARAEAAAQGSRTEPGMPSPEGEALRAQLAADDEKQTKTAEELRAKDALISELQSQIHSHVELLEELQSNMADLRQGIADKNDDLEAAVQELAAKDAELEAARAQGAAAKVRSPPLYECRPGHADAFHGAASGYSYVKSWPLRSRR